MAINVERLRSGLGSGGGECPQESGELMIEESNIIMFLRGPRAREIRAEVRVS